MINQSINHYLAKMVLAANGFGKLQSVGPNFFLALCWLNGQALLHMSVAEGELAYKLYDKLCAL